MVQFGLRTARWIERRPAYGLGWTVGAFAIALAGWLVTVNIDVSANDQLGRAISAVAFAVFSLWVPLAGAALVGLSDLLERRWTRQRLAVRSGELRMLYGLGRVQEREYEGLAGRMAALESGKAAVQVWLARARYARVVCMLVVPVGSLIAVGYPNRVAWSAARDQPFGVDDVAMLVTAAVAGVTVLVALVAGAAAWGLCLRGKAAYKEELRSLEQGLTRVLAHASTMRPRSEGMQDDVLAQQAVGS